MNMLTYSKIKDLDVPPEYIITKENLKDITNPHPEDKEYGNWEDSLSKIFEHRTRAAAHNFVYIANKAYAWYTGGGCTGSFCSGTYTGPKNITRGFPAAITGSDVFVANAEHQKYLNLLLNPLTSPYSWLMKPDTYKVIVDEKGNIRSWFILDNRIRAAYMGGLLILERIWRQHGPDNVFWNYWKKRDELPFAAFFLFTHSAYMSQTKYHLSWPLPQTPYSTFDMYNNHGRGNSVQRFSAPRLFQSIPNHEIYTEVFSTYNDVLLKSNRNHNPDNIVWSGKPTDPDVIVTMNYETELKQLIIRKSFIPDGWGKYKAPKDDDFCNELMKTFGDKFHTDFKTRQQAGLLWMEYMLENVHNLILKHVPEFYNTKVA